MSRWVIADASTSTVRGGAGRLGDEPQRLVPEVRRVREEELVREAEEDEPGDGLVLGVAVDAAEEEVLVRARLARCPSEHRRSAAGRRAGRARAATRRRRRRSPAGRRAASRRRSRRSRAARRSWSIRQSCRKPRQSTSPITAAMMIAASVACGQAVEQRRQEQHRGDEQQPRRTGPTAACARPLPRRQRCARGWRRRGSPGAAPAAEVGRAERDELLVRVDLVAALRPRASARRRSTLPSRRARARAAPPLRAPTSPRPSAGSAGGRQACRDVRDHGDAVGREVEGAAEPRPRRLRRRAPTAPAGRGGGARGGRAATRSPTSGVSQPISSSEPISARASRARSRSATVSPRSFGNWPTMIRTPIPLMKPTSTGRARNSETKPSRSRPGGDEDDAREHRESGEQRRVLLRRERRLRPGRGSPPR